MSDQEQSNVTNCDKQRLWHQNPNEAGYYTSSILDELTGFHEVPSFPLQEAINEDVDFGSSEKGQGSGMKRKGDYDPMETTRVEEDGMKEDSDGRSEHSKQQKRTRSAEVHNLNERLRRQRLKEKIKALQELIPNCSKRDKSSTFDDAIKYIKTLQHQVQVMSMGAGYSTLNSPPTMMPHPQQQGMQIPNSAAFLTANGIKYGIGTGTGMGMSAMFPSGLSNQCLLPSSAVNFTCPVVLCPTSIEPHGSKSTCQGATSASSQAPIQSNTRRESTTRSNVVLPSKIVQPHHSKEVMDYGCSHSGSTEERSSSSTAKWKDPLFLTGISLLEDDDDDDDDEDEGGP